MDTTSAAGPELLSFAPRARRRELATGTPGPLAVAGAALFADISGFTALTELLADELGPNRGAEEMAVHLANVYDVVIAEIEGYGGDVIGFSGDAVGCWFDGDDGLHAAACAIAVQRAMQRVGTITTGNGSTTTISIKVAIAVGPAARFVVGDPEVQLIDVLAGDLLEELAATERLARPGDNVLAPSAVRALGERVAITSTRSDSEIEVSLFSELLTTDVPTPTPVVDPFLTAAQIRPWILPRVFDRLTAGQSAFLAELRPVVPLFVRFTGLDIEGDPHAPANLDSFVRACQQIAVRYDGVLLQLTIGDKGAYFYMVFGAPVAHQNDIDRALGAALDIAELADHPVAGELHMGITRGRVYSGSYGHPDRRTFGCLGDAANLAARLMTAAPAGRIFVTDTVRAKASGSFRFAEFGPLTVKGKTTTVSVHELLDRDASGSERPTNLVPLVGRTEHLAEIRNAADAARSGNRRVVAVVGDAGAGTSRLLAEFAADAKASGWRVVVGGADSVERHRSYVAWREPLRLLLDLPADLGGLDLGLHLAEALAPLGPGRSERAPLLGTVFGVELEDSALTASFDSKLRRTSLESLITDIVRTATTTGPLAIVLDDVHWLDELSLSLLDVLVRRTARLPVVLVLGGRRHDAGVERVAAAAGAGFVTVEPGRLEGELGEQLVVAHIAALWGDRIEPASEVVRLVAERSDGNPFSVESIVAWMHARGLDPVDPGSIDGMELPDDLHSLVLSRLDTLPEGPRLTLKVAGVLGMSFEPIEVAGVHLEEQVAASVSDHLVELDDADLLEGDDEELWHFRHRVTRDVAYESLPFALRAALHRSAGHFLERRLSEGTAIDLDLLAHHFANSDETDKTIEYLERAGEAAQARYATGTATDHYRRLAGLVTGAKRADVLVRLAKVLELSGDWDGAREQAQLALDEAVADDHSLGEARAEVTLAELDRRQGAYERAGERLTRADRLFATADDDAGVAQALHLAGTLAAQQGDHATARDRYRSSLAIRTQLGDRHGMAASLSNLGVVAEYEGDYAGALEFHRQALRLRTESADMWGIAVSLTNIGMIAIHEQRFADARTDFASAMELCVEVGDRWMVAISHHNLGNALRGLGDTAAAASEYAAAATTYVEYGDDWAIAFLLEDVALLAAALGDSTAAARLVGAADGRRETLGSPRSPAAEEPLLAEIALEPDAIVKERSLGAQLDADGAISLLEHTCNAAVT